MATAAHITPSVLRWARERNNLTIETVAEQIGTAPEHYEAWEKGKTRPTFRQAQLICQKLNIPFGYLFLASPPEDRLPLPDLRTVARELTRQASPELQDAVSDAVAKQEWYREYKRGEGGSPVSLVKSFSPDASADTIAADIRTTIGFNDAMRREAITSEHFLRGLVENVESAGILVLRSGIVGHNTDRILSVHEFRGFVISDYLAPLIFIHDRDTTAAQIFTLAYGLAHLWIGQSGIAHPENGPSSNHQPSVVEDRANRIAAETVLPNAELQATWDESRTAEANLQTVMASFRTSSAVALGQVYQLRLVSSTEFAHLTDRLTKRQSSEEPKETGGDSYNRLIARSSRRLMIALYEALSRGRITYRDAAFLLGVKVDSLDGISSYVGKLST